MFPTHTLGRGKVRPELFFRTLCLCRPLYDGVRYLLSISSVPLLLQSEDLGVRSVLPICLYYPGRRTAMEATREQKIKCYCSQRLVLQIAQNGLADLESAEIDSAQLLPPHTQ